MVRGLLEVKSDMIKSIRFHNFKVLDNATLPLSRFTLIVGPNGSGKSTAMEALHFARNPGSLNVDAVLTAELRSDLEAEIEVEIEWDVNSSKIVSKSRAKKVGSNLLFNGPEYKNSSGGSATASVAEELNDRLAGFRIFSFQAESIAAPVQLTPGNRELAPDGSSLAGVLDLLRDSEPERFEALNEELRRWLPEFDRILFDTPAPGLRAFLLRTHAGKHKMRASDLSHGTLFALAILTLTYLPKPPSIICIEDPEKGIHPRLLREIRDGMYRLCYPEDYGDKRDSVQVIATTHSPFLLDLYKDHPEEVVIAHKDEQGVHFERLSEKPDVDEFLQDAPLSEVWYSGVLGGVPAKP